MSKTINIVGTIPTKGEERFNVMMKSLERHLPDYNFNGFILHKYDPSLRDQLSRGILPELIQEGNPDMIGLCYISDKRPAIKEMKQNIINPLKALNREYECMVFGVTPDDAIYRQFKTNNLPGIYVEDFMREGREVYKKQPVTHTPRFNLF